VKRWITILALTVGTQRVWAAPNIAGVSASTAISNMGLFNISGSGLGIGPTSGKPAYWWPGNSKDINPSDLGRNTVWDGTLSVSYISSEPATGSSYITAAIGGTWFYWGTGSRGLYTHEIQMALSPAGTQFEIFCLRRHDWDLAGFNVKLLRSEIQTNDWIHEGDDANGVLRFYNEGNVFPDCAAGSNQFSCTSGGDTSEIPPSTWLASNYYWIHGDQTTCGSGAGDGKWSYISNGVLIQYGDYFRNCARDQSSMKLQYAPVHASPSPGSVMDYFTQIYGDDSTYMIWGSSANSNGTCTTITTGTYIEPQIPYAWKSDGSSISARINLGGIDTTYGLCVTVRVDSTTQSNTFLMSQTGTQLGAVLSGVTVSSFTATWTSAGASNYSVAMSSFSDFSTPISSGNLAGVTSGYIGLNPSTTYYFEVKVSTEGSYNGAVSTATLPQPAAVIPFYLYNTKPNLSGVAILRR
jgi:hypothetical protein